MPKQGLSAHTHSPWIGLALNRLIYGIRCQFGHFSYDFAIILLLLPFVRSFHSSADIIWRFFVCCRSISQQSYGMTATTQFYVKQNNNNSNEKVYETRQCDDASLHIRWFVCVATMCISVEKSGCCCYYRLVSEWVPARCLKRCISLFISSCARIILILANHFTNNFNSLSCCLIQLQLASVGFPFCLSLGYFFFIFLLPSLHSNQINQCMWVHYHCQLLLFN